MLALVIFSAFFSFVPAGLEAAWTFGSPKAGPGIGHSLLALAGLAAG